jgi:hypothetical protein
VGERVALHVRLLDATGWAIERTAEGDAADPEAVGLDAAEQLLAAGGAALLAALRARGAS